MKKEEGLSCSVCRVFKELSKGFESNKEEIEKSMVSSMKRRYGRYGKRASAIKVGFVIDKPTRIEAVGMLGARLVLFFCIEKPNKRETKRSWMWLDGREDSGKTVSQTHIRL